MSVLNDTVIFAVNVGVYVFIIIAIMVFVKKVLDGIKSMRKTKKEMDEEFEKLKKKIGEVK